MMEEEEYEMIERYLNNEMSELDREVFEKRLESDAKLRNLLEEVKLTNELVIRANDEQLKKELDSIHAEVVDDNVVSINRGKFSWKSMAAVVVVLIGISAAVFYMFSSDPDGQKLFADHYDKMEVPSYVRDAQIVGEDPWNSFIGLYENNQFEKALAIDYKNLESEVPTYLWELYRGVCHLSMSNSNEAIESFEMVESTFNNYRDQALWYKSLAYIQNSDFDKALISLNKLKKDHAQFRREEVNALIREIE